MTKTFRITSPDGKTYDVTGPDDATPEQALQQVQSKAQPAAPQFDIDFAAPVSDVRTKVLALPEDQQDLAWNEYAKSYVGKERASGYKPAPAPNLGGVMDEISAGAEAIPNLVTGGAYGPSYSEALAIQRERERQAAEAHPVMDTIGELGVGVVGPGSFLKSGAGLLGNTVRGAGAGAVYGGGLGFGNSEGGFENRLKGAKQGAKVGAVVGAVAPGGIALAARGAGAIRDAVAPKIASQLGQYDKAATMVLANKAKKSGQTPQEIMKYLDEGRGTAKFGTGEAHLPETIADVNDTMQRTAGSIYRGGGEAAEDVKGFLDARQKGPRNPYDAQPDEMPGQLADVRDATQRALAIKSSKSGYRTENDLLAKTKAEADVLYQKARDNSEDFDLQPAIDGFVLKAQDYRGPFRAEMMKAVDLFADPMQRNTVRSINNITRFDAAKKQLDDIIDGAKGDFGKATNLSRELEDFKHALLNRVHADDTGALTRNLAYKEARENFGSNAEMRDALNTGRKALDENSEITVEQFKAMTPGEKKLARIGLLDAVDKRSAGKKPGDNATLLFQQKRVRAIMDEMIPGRKKGPQFGEYMARQENMSTTRNTALGGSPTAKNLQDDAENAAETMGTMWDKFRSHPTLFNVGVEAISGGMRRMFGYNQAVAQAMAKRLLATDRTEQVKALAEIRMRMGQQDWDRFNVAMGRLARAAAMKAGSSNAVTAEDSKPLPRLSQSKPPQSAFERQE